ncbi:NfeD family protein [Terrarubrum flagellatum]|uniref:NfeD family protein n=1 Tax=Terrirubrum flagellatum TaxID=2895980 RepID=UPI0031452B34
MPALGPYLWIIGGLVVSILELFAPGVYLLWFGLAGVAVGGLVWFWPLEFFGELVAFAGFAIVAVALGYFLTKRATDNEGEQPFLNRRGEQLVGRTVTLSSGIENGVGRLSVDDTIWRAEGPDMPAGSRAVITGVSGTTLMVKAAA